MRTLLTGLALTSLAVGAASAAEPKAGKVPPKEALIMSIGKARLDIPKMPHTLKMIVDGQVPTTGWKPGHIVPMIYIQPPPDGIYEVKVYGVKPSGSVGQMVSPIHIEQSWKNYPEKYLKGVKFVSATNSVTAPLPPVKP